MNKLLVLLMLTGCATSQIPPETRIVEISQETRVCVDRVPLSAGEQITVRRKNCHPATAKTMALRCGPEQVEAAEVLHVVDERCAIVRLPSDAQLHAGDVLQVSRR